MGRFELVRDIVVTLQLLRGRFEQILTISVPVAIEMLLQVAVIDIGQLTDIETMAG